MSSTCCTLPSAQQCSLIDQYAASCVEDDGVFALRVFDRDLTLSDIESDALGIALAWVAPTARAGQNMAEDIASADGQPALSRQLARLTFRVEKVPRRRTRPTTAQAVRQVSAAVAAQLQHSLIFEEPIVAYQGETTAEHAGTARVGKIAIALDPQWRFGFD